MFNLSIIAQNELKNKISQHYRTDEKQCIDNLLTTVKFSQEQENKIKNLATDLVMKVRNMRIKGNGVDAVMQEFKLSSDEGIALMCLAESLLRIPDKNTQDLLIRDKITKGKWSEHTKSGNFFVNAASWGLMITGKLVASYNNEGLSAHLINLLAKGGEPLIRKAMSIAVRLMGNQFVMSETIESALKSAEKKEALGYRFSYDMLGEAAMTDEDALKYMQSYIDAIKQVGMANNGRGVYKGPGISVKLSAIHPRYQRIKRDRVMNELYPRLKQLYLLAKEYQLGLFIDAEESERLEISLDLLEMLLNDTDLAGFNGIGFVVQSYQKRAPYVIDYVANLAKESKQRVMLRLVKGAYWDSEIKKAQVDGQLDYPVYTRKTYTDLCYLACANKLLQLQEHIYPLFATHNAYSLAAIYVMGEGREYEFQCLYGMGETLYDNVVGKDNLNVSCRVYAPVGTYDTLLAYLVRRLLENGANSSFVHQLVDKNIPISELVVNPLAQAKIAAGKSNPYFAKPPFIYPQERVNSLGLDLSDEITLQKMQDELNNFASKQYAITPLLANFVVPENRVAVAVKSPAQQSDIVGNVIKNTLEDIDNAVNNARVGFEIWSQTDVSVRAQSLLKMADLLEENYIELLSILVREAGKTLNNAIAEVREAVDFCRYYAKQAINELDNSKDKALGVMVCISPWNFPLAIFLGEISSALVAGNSVIAKPSDQTNIIAFFAVKLFHNAGVPENVLQLILGSGSVVGNALTKHEHVAGVIFTGSTEVAQQINRNLAEKSFTSVLIAETGGQNTMIVDSTALPEQVINDVITSGFDSAGQRCSALRVLYLQADIADKFIHMLKGAMDELHVGNPCLLSTDVGPVIDTRAQAGLLSHIDKMKKQARICYQTKLSAECQDGIYVAPTLFEIGSIKELEREVFGPVVHIVRFDADALDDVIAEINSSGYGLTQGLHSRVESTAQKVYSNVRAGNIYINRNMVGAVVGVQPFGGEGLSGTGPKAGGPLYIHRLVNRNLSVDVDRGDDAINYHSSGGLVSEKEVDFSYLDKFVSGFIAYGFDEQQSAELLQIALQCKKHSPLANQIELIGPTGERNFMFFDKRGYVACFAENKFETAKQVIYALSCNNDVVVAKINGNEIFANYLPPLSYLTQYPVEAVKLNAALISANYANVASLKKKLAKRDGVIVNLVMESAGGYNLHLLATERSVSINVTATGGNVQLMSIEDNI